MADEPIVPVVVAYAAEFAETGDAESFRGRVLRRYTEGTLCRLLRDSPDIATRRCVAIALGMTGTLASNATIAAALRDDDAELRKLAEQALWGIWFRADTEENNAWLRRVSGLIASGDPARAVELATLLVERAPRFAEAYNQRAIAHWLMHDWVRSIADCKRVLELNPHHFGAQSGMAQCYIRLGEYGLAIESLRQAMEMNRNLEHLREVTVRLEKEMGR